MRIRTLILFPRRSSVIGISLDHTSSVCHLFLIQMGEWLLLFESLCECERNGFSWIGVYTISECIDLIDASFFLHQEEGVFSVDPN